MFLINVEAAVFKEDKWLLIRRSTKEAHAGGELSLVGGTVEREGDSTAILERTLRRELFEEVGVEVKDPIQYVRNTSFVLENGKEVVDIVFLCEFEKGEPYAKSPNEVESVHWMTTDEIIKNVEIQHYLKDSILAADAIKARGEF
ncbi:NUDIX domain-containing protein [Psychrobacillus sp. NEAU-3TGS]|uniref:NUDIX hydrolase n=1 Tax=Psychrobacillus sp. NEAU-3TGS TaxID=2995412 RepID=UPI00249672A7|nr:NUDIX domain-containing protein [Psychrobacillus sp. NEAU-3TGS]MDI2586675.1 NUDIX domain-containing protein [Psychrobacillus sp. NEAU-3TGS]